MRERRRLVSSFVCVCLACSLVCIPPSPPRHAGFGLHVMRPSCARTCALRHRCVSKPNLKVCINHTHRTRRSRARTEITSCWIPLLGSNEPPISFLRTISLSQGLHTSGSDHQAFSPPLPAFLGVLRSSGIISSLSGSRLVYLCSIYPSINQFHH